MSIVAACNASDDSSDGTGSSQTMPGDGAQPADTWLNCKGLDAVQCMEKCAEAGAPCAPKMKHPKKPEAGWGDLYMCKTGLLTHVCSYYYSNDDECIFFWPVGRLPWCVYVGGKPK